ncbi:hypothetical protein [Streptomyces sp. NPDC053367]
MAMLPYLRHVADHMHGTDAEVGSWTRRNSALDAHLARMDT